MKHVLIFNLPPALEEDMVDFLLSRDHIQGFTSFRCQGHGEHGALSLSEQVAGRRQRVRFELIVDEERMASLIERLPQEVGRGITYWSYPVGAIGRS